MYILSKTAMSKQKRSKTIVTPKLQFHISLINRPIETTEKKIKLKEPKPISVCAIKASVSEITKLEIILIENVTDHISEDFAPFCIFVVN